MPHPDRQQRMHRTQGAARLKQEAERIGGLQKLANLLKDAPVRGRSRSMLYNYTADPAKYRPRRETWDAIAGALNVRVEWLMWGEGERTEGEQALSEARKRKLQGTGPADQIRRHTARWLAARLGLHTDFPEIAGVGGATEALCGEVAESYRALAYKEEFPPDRLAGTVLAALHHAGINPDDLDEETLKVLPALYVVAIRVGRALRAPLDELRVDPADLAPQRLKDYVLAVAPALLAVQPFNQGAALRRALDDFHSLTEQEGGDDGTEE